VHPGVRRPRVFVSARDGSGLAALRQLIADAAMGRLNTEIGASSGTGQTPYTDESASESVSPSSTLA